MNRSLTLGVALLAGLALSLVSSVEAQNCCRRGRILQRVQVRGMFQRNNCCNQYTSTCNTGCNTGCVTATPVQSSCGGCATTTPVYSTPVQSSCGCASTTPVYSRPIARNWGGCNTGCNTGCSTPVVSNSCGSCGQSAYVSTRSCGSCGQCTRSSCGGCGTVSTSSCGCGTPVTTSSCGCGTTQVATTTSSCGCSGTVTVQPSANNVVPQGNNEVKPQPAKGSDPPKPDGAKASGDDT